jgi:hypothetical protein
VGWQIDTFGHSSLGPWLFGSAGYQAVALNRVHHRTKVGGSPTAL